MPAPLGDLSRLPEMLQGFHRQADLIPALQRVQEEFGYVPPPSLEVIAGHLGLFPAQVQGVVSFYHMFFTEPRGRHVVTVCRGTACHVKGGKGVLRVVQKILGLADGETSEDYQFTLETVACLGACALSPVMVVDGRVFGRLNPKRIENVLDSLRKTE
ncbi:MAG: NADH-quinone oxidoreductase subunit NuoE [Deltaproteobacteria bacterium]|nr:NADH-quinone oxidoreductase subunit NuoE [Deltaproteobacteria bacterium]